MQREPREVLGVAKDATEEEIKRAYKRRAAVCHPDRGGKRQEWDELQRAYFLLTNRHAARSEPLRGDGWTVPIEQIIPAIDAGISGLADMLRGRAVNLGAGTWWGEAFQRASATLISEAETAAKAKVIGDLRNATKTTQGS